MSARNIPEGSPGCPPEGMSFHPKYPFRQPTPVMQLSATCGSLGWWELLKEGRISKEEFADLVGPTCEELWELNRLIAEDKGWDGGIYPYTEEYVKRLAWLKKRREKR